MLVCEFHGFPFLARLVDVWKGAVPISLHVLMRFGNMWSDFLGDFAIGPYFQDRGRGTLALGRMAPCDLPPAPPPRRGPRGAEFLNALWVEAAPVLFILQTSAFFWGHLDF